LVAFPINTDFFLCEFQLSDFQPEFKDKNLWYVSMGSSQPITDTFLAFIRDVFWKDDLSEFFQNRFFNFSFSQPVVK